MATVSDYLSELTGDDKVALERIATITKDVVPDAEEGISYGMPAFKYHGRPLIGFVAAKDHLSLFPFSPAVVEAVHDQLDGYETSKGTIRFTAEKPLSESLIRDIINHRLEELEKKV